MEEEKTENKELSFGGIIRTILSRKFLALIIMVAITLAGTLALYFGYNAAKNQYESSFTINFPVTDGGLIEYPDGKSRNYRDFVSEENLKKVKATSVTLKDIDVSKMIKEGGISIAQQSGNKSSFTIKVKTYYFSSENVAEQFIDSIVHTVTRDLQNNIDKNAESVRKGFENSLGNERKVEFLSKQIDYFTARFNGIENMSTEALVEIDSLTYTLKALKGSLHTHFYESDVDALKSFVSVRVELKRQLESAQAVLDNLMKAGANASADSTGSSVIIQGADIVYYTQKVDSLTKEISDLENYLEPYKVSEGQYSIPEQITDKNNEKFDNSLSGVLDGVCELSTKYEAEHWLYYPAVSYDGQRVNLVYGFKLVYCIIISLLVGIIVAAIVAYAVARRSEKKSAVNAAENAEPADVEIKEVEVKEDGESKEN